MLVDLVLHNAKIYLPQGLVKAGLAVDEGKILKIAKETNLPHASEKLNMKGKIMLPGLIDPHVHLRDQQLAYKEDFLSGTSAAAAGGVTLTIDMPNNKPVTMSAKSLKERMKMAEKRVIVNVAFHSAFPENLEEIPQIVKQGAVAFKLYLSQKVGAVEIEDDNALLRAFSRAGKMKVPVSVHAEDKKTLETVKKEMQKAGRTDIEAYLKVHSPHAELKAIQHTIQLAKKTSVHIHFCHVSSAEGLKALLTAKNMGLPVSCEATPHHLLLSSKHLKRYKTIALTDPPLRAEEDVEALWNAFRNGLIDALASDHAPHTVEEKEAESIWNVRKGIPGLETTLPLLLTQINKGRLTMPNLIRATSKRPAEIFHLRDRGSLAEGCWADLVVVDMKREY
ncbi:dihydroorotase family protein, partial [Candidatus Bathyarchaeota archaeon]|nr:dihydroorotase family protein [Candidatus Bathyarchaeota archaeon]